MKFMNANVYLTVPLEKEDNLAFDVPSEDTDIGLGMDGELVILDHSKKQMRQYKLDRNGYMLEAEGELPEQLEKKSRVYVCKYDPSFVVQAENSTTHTIEKQTDTDGNVSLRKTERRETNESLTLIGNIFSEYDVYKQVG